MHATPTSRIKSKISPIIRKINIKALRLAPWEPSRVSNKWPATILAASRIERVPGRIIFLTDSITTIKGIRGPGVPEGTKWANTELN